MFISVYCHLGSSSIASDSKAAKLWRDERITKFMAHSCPDQPEVYSPLKYAQRLATTIWEKHYKQDSPDWKPLPDLLGVLTQIDNMITGMERRTGAREET